MLLPDLLDRIESPAWDKPSCLVTEARKPSHYVRVQSNCDGWSKCSLNKLSWCMVFSEASSSLKVSVYGQSKAQQSAKHPTSGLILARQLRPPKLWSTSTSDRVTGKVRSNHWIPQSEAFLHSRFFSTYEISYWFPFFFYSLVILFPKRCCSQCGPKHRRSIYGLVVASTEWNDEKPQYGSSILLFSPKHLS